MQADAIEREVDGEEGASGLPSFSKGGNAQANGVQAFRYDTRMNERNL